MNVTEHEVKQVAEDMGIDSNTLLLEEIDRVQAAVEDEFLPDRLVEIIETNIQKQLDER